jgi:hypothetical protein
MRSCRSADNPLLQIGRSTVATAQIAYETETGRILLIHHFVGEPANPQSARQVAALFTDVAEDGITVMSVPADEIDSNRSYTVDPSRTAVIEATPDGGGIRSGVTEMRPPG